MSKVVVVVGPVLQLNYNFERRIHNLGNEKWKVKVKKAQAVEWNMKSKSQKYNLVIRNEFGVKPATYSTTMTTDIPLYETPEALFDEYLEQKSRVFNAMFPDKHSIQQLNQDDWRIKMLPFQFLGLKVWPIIDFKLRCKSKGRDYPPQVPQHITKLVELHNTRWELQGLDSKYFDPSQHFKLGVKGILYPDRRGNKSRIRGSCEMNITVVFLPALTLIPDGIRDTLLKRVMRDMAERMNQNVDGSLLADYTKFKKERSDKLPNCTKH